MTRLRRRRWAIAGGVLLAAAALLLVLRWPGSGAAPPRAPAEFPRWREPERARLKARTTLVLPPAAPAAALPAAPPAAPRRRDPFLVSLPVKPDAPVVVFEANALRHSRLGELLVACIEAREPGRLAALKRETGLDPLKDVDRVAFLGDALVVSGFFAPLRWEGLDGPVERYGEAGRVFRQRGKSLGTWGDGLLVVADRPEDVRQAIDQLEGRSPVPEAGVPEELSYGEVYGAIPVAAVRRVLGSGALFDGLAAARRIELNVNATQDLAATVRIRGEGAGGLSGLASALGSALTLARGQAQAAGDDRLAALLEGATVAPGAQGLTVQLAVPADRLAQWFEGCERWGPPPERR